MASIDIYFPFLLSFEGKEFVNDPTDKGGATKMGVTFSTFKQWGWDNDKDGDIDVDDLKLETPDQAKSICKRIFWDRWQADKINNQSIAEELVEWVWGSGATGIKKPQALLGLKVDGNVGPVTLAAINNADPKKLFIDIRTAKFAFLNNLITNSVLEYKKEKPNATQAQLLKYTQLRFQNGWFRRINSLIFTP